MGVGLLVVKESWDVLLDKFRITSLVDDSEDTVLFHFLGDEQYSLGVDGFVVNFEKLRMVCVTDYGSYSELKFVSKCFSKDCVISVLVSQENYCSLRFYRS